MNKHNEQISLVKHHVTSWSCCRCSIRPLPYAAVCWGSRIKKGDASCLDKLVRKAGTELDRHLWQRDGRWPSSRQLWTIHCIGCTAPSPHRGSASVTAACHWMNKVRLYLSIHVSPKLTLTVIYYKWVTLTIHWWIQVKPVDFMTPSCNDFLGESDVSVLYRSEFPSDWSRVLTAVNAYRGALLSHLTMTSATLANSPLYVLTDCKAGALSCSPTLYTHPPQAATAITARVAFRTALGVLLNQVGATVRVNKMATAVLRATIWPTW